MRDMSRAQFQRAVESHGFTSEGFMGYYRLPIPNRHVSVSIWNAGTNRRAQLAYLLQKQEQEESRMAAAQPKEQVPQPKGEAVAQP